MIELGDLAPGLANLLAIPVVDEEHRLVKAMTG